MTPGEGMLASSAGLKAAAFVTSAVLHVGIAVAAVTGHDSASDGTSDVELTVEVLPAQPAPEAVPEVEPATPETERVAPVRARPAAIPPSHTHAYPVAVDHDAHPHDPSLPHAHAPMSAPASAPTVPATPPADPHGDDHDHGSVEHAPAAIPILGSPITIQSRGGAEDGSPVANGGGASRAQGDGPSAPEIVPESRVTTRAAALRRVQPEYPALAIAEQVEATIVFEIVVDTSGAVISARALSRAGYGFEGAAAAALRRFRFSPALVDGVPVRVRMTWPVEFKLR